MERLKKQIRKIECEIDAECDKTINHMWEERLHNETLLNLFSKLSKLQSKYIRKLENN